MCDMRSNNSTTTCRRRRCRAPIGDRGCIQFILGGRMLVRSDIGYLHDYFSRTSMLSPDRRSCRYSTQSRWRSTCRICDCIPPRLLVVVVDVEVGQEALEICNSF